MEVLVAVMVMDCKAEAVTVSASVFDVTPLCVAVMLLEPIPAPVAKPLVLMLAAAVFDELQFAEVVRFCVVPSVKVPVAVN